MLFVNPERDRKAAFGRPAEERADQVEEGAYPRQRGKSFRDRDVGRSDRHRAYRARA